MNRTKRPSNQIIRKTNNTNIQITLYKGSKIDRKYSIPNLSFVYLNEISEYLSSRFNDVTATKVQEYIRETMRKRHSVVIKNTNFSILGTHTKFKV